MWLYSYYISFWLSKNLLYIKSKQILFTLCTLKNNNLLVKMPNLPYLCTNYYFNPRMLIMNILYPSTFQTCGAHPGCTPQCWHFWSASLELRQIFWAIICKISSTSLSRKKLFKKNIIFLSFFPGLTDGWYCTYDSSKYSSWLVRSTSEMSTLRCDTWMRAHHSFEIFVGLAF